MLAGCQHMLQPSLMLQRGWRDCRQSQYRLFKGDAQLDHTYAMSDTPHHISNDPMSELSYCISMARRLPVSLLTSVVRSHFEPAEYPATIQQLYNSTPDECLPEFYLDPQVSAGHLFVVECQTCIEELANGDIHAMRQCCSCIHCFE